MIRINVAEIKKRLVGSKEFSYELTPDELGITEADLKITAPVVLKGMVENAGDVILLKAEAATEIERTCGRCLKVYTEKLNAQVVEKFYPAGAENIENDAFIYESDLLDITEPFERASFWQFLCKHFAGKIAVGCVRSAGLTEMKATAAVIQLRLIPDWRH